MSGVAGGANPEPGGDGKVLIYDEDPSQRDEDTAA